MHFDWNSRLSRKRYHKHKTSCRAGFSASAELLVHFIFNSFTVKFGKELRRRLGLKLPPHLKPAAPLYLAKSMCSTIQLYSTVNSVQSTVFSVSPPNGMVRLIQGVCIYFYRYHWSNYAYWFCVLDCCQRPGLPTAQRRLFNVTVLKGYLLSISLSTPIILQRILRRSSADADKPARRVYRSVKVTKHGTIRYRSMISY